MPFIQTTEACTWINWQILQYVATTYSWELPASLGNPLSLPLSIFFCFKLLIEILMYHSSWLVFKSKMLCILFFTYKLVKVQKSVSTVCSISQLMFYQHLLFLLNISATCGFLCLLVMPVCHHPICNSIQIHLYSIKSHNSYPKLLSLWGKDPTIITESIIWTIFSLHFIAGQLACSLNITVFFPLLINSCKPELCERENQNSNFKGLNTKSFS